MLSRTADSLYWMARNMERAENMARFLDVAQRMSLLPGGTALEHQEWDAPLLITGLYNDFFERYPVRNADNVLQFLAFDRDNTSSIHSCLAAARENGRAVRGAMTVEMWEDINATWLEFKDMTLERAREMGLAQFFNRVKTRSHLFRGVTHGTMLQDEAFHFIRMGTFIERADNTARLLDVKYHILLPSVTEVGGGADYYQWGALLRSVSAFQAYRKCYRNQITPQRVGELLILRADMPRSLHHCMVQIDDILARLGGGEASRLAGELHSRLRYGRVEDIFETGFHEYLTDFLARIARLGGEIHRGFFAPS